MSKQIYQDSSFKCFLNLCVKSDGPINFEAEGVITIRTYILGPQGIIISAYFILIFFLHELYVDMRYPNSQRKIHW